jgi:acetyltransferase-like isoleucine patch superfamily enzyme
MAEKIQKQLFGGGGKGRLARYREIVAGSCGNAFLLRYELCQLFLRNLPGLLGLALRGTFYRGLFRRAGRGLLVGAGVTLRNPRAIELGDRVVLDDGCVLDAKGLHGRGIRIGDDVFLSRQAAVTCKDGSIELGNDITVGPQTIIQSVGDSAVRIGSHVSIAPTCYLVGCPDYRFDRRDIPMKDQGFGPGLGIEVEDDVWIGASTILLDGARVRRGAVVGALSLVRGEIEPYGIAVGIPARKKRDRP